MTQEEYDREQQEIQQLINEINALRAENAALEQEINQAVSNVRVLRSNVATLHRAVEPVMHGVSGEIDVQAGRVQEIQTALEELTAQYFTFKTLSTASKNLTRYTDEYHTRFSFYNRLRRITLGYVIGLDTNFVSDESLRKSVEKIYLQNTEYWLAYATMGVMLWASDEKEAADRAVSKAMFLNPAKASLFYMLICLRFGRQQAAQEWFVTYMNRVDSSGLGDEFQYLLQAYLGGSFGGDAAFQEAVERDLKALLERAEATTADFGRRFADKACSFAESYLHRTGETFVYLKSSCADYPILEETLSAAEKNALLAQYYGELAAEAEEETDDLRQRIENVLYTLVSSYDGAELEVVQKMRENEAIISAGGDAAAAKKKMDEDFGGLDRRRTLAELMMDWAFAGEKTQTPVSVRKFAVSTMREEIARGYARFAENYQKKEQPAYSFTVDGCTLSAGEGDFETAKPQLEAYYEHSKPREILKDKFSLIFLGMTILGLLTLAIMALSGFSPFALTIGVLLVLSGSFLLWRRISAMLEQQKEKKRLGVLRLQHCLEELGAWREQYRRENEKSADLQRALREFTV